MFMAPHRRRRVGMPCRGGGPLGPGLAAARRCPSAWWAPPPSKRVGRVIPVRRVRFPSTSAMKKLLVLAVALLLTGVAVRKLREI